MHAGYRHGLEAEKLLVVPQEEFIDTGQRHTAALLLNMERLGRGRSRC